MQSFSSREDVRSAWQNEQAVQPFFFASPMSQAENERISDMGTAIYFDPSFYVRLARASDDHADGILRALIDFSVRPVLSRPTAPPLPNRSARILLAVIDKEPEAVERALSKCSQHHLAMPGLADRRFTAESLQQVVEKFKLLLAKACVSEGCPGPASTTGPLSASLVMIDAASPLSRTRSDRAAI
ncbi:MAG: hypothetical protein V3T83_09770 [Acidobacteriota bacterium]